MTLIGRLETHLYCLLVGAYSQGARVRCSKRVEVSEPAVYVNIELFMSQLCVTGLEIPFPANYSTYQGVQ